MANINKTERIVKAQCLSDAFIALKQKSIDTGKSLTSVPQIVSLANLDSRMKKFEKPIGEKSIYSNAKNSVYKPILEIIQKWNQTYAEEVSMATKVSKQKLRNINLKLEDSEMHLIELQEEILRLNNIITNKEQIILQVENERNQYAAQLAVLRK